MVAKKTLKLMYKGRRKGFLLAFMVVPASFASPKTQTTKTGALYLLGFESAAKLGKATAQRNK